MIGRSATRDRFVWDDELWELVWERRLNQVERHAIARETWARSVPKADLMRARIVTELARRWRRTARNFAFLYGLWTLFWATMALRTRDFEPSEITWSNVGLPTGARDVLTTPTATELASIGRLLWGLVAVGAVAIVVSLAVRWRMREVAKLRP